MQSNLNNQLEMANKWLFENQLTLNATKTKFMLFGTNAVKSGNVNIERVSKYKYLGFMLDPKSYRELKC